MECITCDGKVIIPTANDAKEEYRNKLRKDIIDAIQNAINENRTSTEVEGYLPDWLINEIKEAGYSIIEITNPLTYVYRISFQF